MTETMTETRAMEPKMAHEEEKPHRLENLAEEIGRHANAEVVFGKPVEHGGVTVIPVARARWGFGGSAGRMESGKAGMQGGGGMVMSPLGYIEIAGGTSHFRPIVDLRTVARVLLAGAMLALLFRRR